MKRYTVIQKASHLLLMVAGVISSATLAEGQPPGSVGAHVTYVRAPAFTNISENPLITIRVHVLDGEEAMVRQINLSFDPASVGLIEKVNLLKGETGDEFPAGSPLASVPPSAQGIQANFTCRPGLTYFTISIVVKAGANIDEKIRGKITGLVTQKSEIKFPASDQQFSFRIGTAVRKRLDDDVHTFRIPGMVATDGGTLLAVYDVRYKNSRDLPGHVDIGMSRSTNRGETWEPMKIIMDMGPPHENNGVGDPSILFDPSTKRIWVAGLWSKGNRSIAGSEPGLSPDSTGQFVLASSSDDGLTWSAPLSITPQVKNPKWHLYFQGPGTGIAMRDGTLVFPSQYWDESKKPGIPHSSIIYSQDHGKSWKSGNGAKYNTTESQVVETLPGTLVLNMRDNRGGFRSISTTKDLGSTWIEHHTSRMELPDPVCMASIIKAEVMLKGKTRTLLFFSNPATSAGRTHLTVRASLDLGETWSDENQLLIDERKTYGYSTLARIDDHKVGLLYEGVGDLFFVRVPIEEIVK